MQAWLGWTIFAVIALLVVAFSFGFVAYYKLKDEPAGVTGTIGFLALLFTLLSLFLIPIDVYMVSSDSYSQQLEDDVKYTYYGFYLIFMFFVFVGLPFAYFYYEELGDLQDRNNTFGKRACQALKYTSCFAFTWIVLIVIGMFVDFSSSSKSSGNNEWTKYVSDQFKSNVSHIIPFCMAVLICVGLFFSMIYTAWGMASFPISLMKSLPVGPQPRSKESLDIELKELTNNLRHIENKYRGREGDMTAKDRARKRTLEHKRKDLEKQRQQAGKRHDAENTCCAKCSRCLWNATAPVRYLVGLLMLGWSILLVASITLHLVDQIINSSCGYECGFAIDKRRIANPIEIVLSETSKVFPIDYIVFGGIVFWLFWTTLVGIMMIDVRFLCFKLFSLRPGATMHNALMMAIMFVILIACSFTYNIYNLAPDYVQFGHQTGCSDCSNDDGCNCTVVYNLITGIMIGMPIFGLIYFIFSWVFVGITVLSLVYNILRTPKPKQNYKLMQEDDGLEAIFRD